jgi:hypothetical protein
MEVFAKDTNINAGSVIWVTSLEKTRPSSSSMMPIHRRNMASPISPTSTAMEDISCWYNPMGKNPPKDPTLSLTHTMQGGGEIVSILIFRHTVNTCFGQKQRNRFATWGHCRLEPDHVNQLCHISKKSLALQFCAWVKP